MRGHGPERRVMCEVCVGACLSWPEDPEVPVVVGEVTIITTVCSRVFSLPSAT